MTKKVKSKLKKIVIQKSGKKPKKNIKQIMLSDKFLVVALSLALLFVYALFAIPISYEKSATKPLAYKTEYKDENAIELGTNKVTQEGISGERYIKYRYTQSLFDYIFRRDSATRKEIENEVQTMPVTEIVLQGTRKYQYMMCSDGSYRYFTNEQFKDRNTGFTSKSPDNCAQNNNGTKIGLADTPSGSVNNTRPTIRPDDCKIIDIPFKTVYKDANWLYVGETKQGYAGYKGFKYSCPDPTDSFTVEPTDRVVYQGTKQKQSSGYSSEPVAPTPDYAAKAKCDADYSSAKAQLSIAGATNSSAMDQLNSLHAQCLRAAGF